MMALTYSSNVGCSRIQAGTQLTDINTHGHRERDMGREQRVSWDCIGIFHSSRSLRVPCLYEWVLPSLHIQL